jgi:hypothetical protein
VGRGFVKAVHLCPCVRGGRRGKNESMRTYLFGAAYEPGWVHIRVSVGEGMGIESKRTSHTLKRKRGGCT